MPQSCDRLRKVVSSWWHKSDRNGFVLPEPTTTDTSHHGLFSRYPMRLLFSSIHCYLDPSSGAALCTRELLELLAARAMDCRVLTTGILDPERETSLDEVLTPLGASHPRVPGGTGNVQGGQGDQSILLCMPSNSFSLLHSKLDPRPVFITSLAPGTVNAFFFLLFHPLFSSPSFSSLLPFPLFVTISAFRIRLWRATFATIASRMSSWPSC